MGKKKKSKKQVALTSLERFIETGSLGRFFFLVFILLGTVWWSYQGSLNDPFVFDTELSLVPANLVDHGIGFDFSLFLSEGRYLGWLSLGWNYALTGMDAAGFRATNIILHGLNALLLFLLIEQLLYAWGLGSKQSLRFFAFIAALAFAVHPMSIYSVVYVIQRFGLLATTFSLLALLFWLRAVLLEKTALYYGAVFFYLLAIHVKEHAVLLPGLFILLFWLFSKDHRSQLKKMIIPFILALLFALHVTWMMKHIVATVYEPNANVVLEEVQKQTPQLSTDDQSMLLWSILNQFWLFFAYLYLWLIPDLSRMAIDVPAPFVMSLTWPQGLGVLMIVAYGVGAIYLVIKRKKYGLIGFALLAPLILFGTELATVRFHENFVLYRSYLWIPCFFTLWAYGLYKLYKKWPKPALLVGVFYIISLIFIQQHRLIPFHSELALWKDVVEKIDLTDKRIPASYRSVGNYATGLGTAGNIKESVRYYRIAADLNPNYVKAWDGIGAALALQGQYQEAIDNFKKAIEVEPVYKEAYYNLGTAYMEQNKLPQAIQVFQKALQIDGLYVEVLYNLGNAYLKSGKATQAIPVYLKAVELHNQDVAAQADVRHNLAIAFSQVGKQKEAIQQYDLVLKVKPNHSKAYYNKANSLAALKKYDQALFNYQKSIQLVPNYVYALHNAGLMLIYLNRASDSIPYLEKAIKLQPDFIPAIEALKKVKAIQVKK